MRVKCIKSKSENNYTDIIVLGYRDKQRNDPITEMIGWIGPKGNQSAIIAGKEYTVYALMFYRMTLLYYVYCGTQCLWIPSDFFEVVNPNIPTDWQLHEYTELMEYPYILLGTNEFSGDPLYMYKIVHLRDEHDKFRSYRNYLDELENL